MASAKCCGCIADRIIIGLLAVLELAILVPLVALLVDLLSENEIIQDQERLSQDCMIGVLVLYSMLFPAIITIISFIYGLIVACKTYQELEQQLIMKQKEEQEEEELEG